MCLGVGGGGEGVDKNKGVKPLSDPPGWQATATRPHRVVEAPAELWAYQVEYSPSETLSKFEAKNAQGTTPRGEGGRGARLPCLWSPGARVAKRTQ